MTRQSLGHFAGRNAASHRARSNDAASATGNLRLFPGCGPVAPVQSPSSTGAGTSSSIATDTAANQAALLRAHHRASLTATLGNISASANSANLIEAWRNRNLLASQQINHLQLAIQIQTQINAAPADADVTVQQMRSLLVALCRAPSEEPPAIQAMAPVPPAPVLPTAPVPPSSVSSAAIDDVRRVRQRVGEPPSTSDAPSEAVVDAMADLMQRFFAVELGGSGNCLFYVLRYLQDHEVGHEILHAHEVQQDEHVDVTRQRIVNHLNREQDNIRDGAGVSLSAAMSEEFGSAEAYLAWIGETTSSGGYIEVVAWAHLMQQHVILHSTTVFASDGALYDEDINPTNTALRAHHILHNVGRGDRPHLNATPLTLSSGGQGGHYRLLQPNLAVAAPAAAAAAAAPAAAAAAAAPAAAAAAAAPAALAHESASCASQCALRVVDVAPASPSH
jgi:hypothetical protein